MYQTIDSALYGQMLKTGASSLLKEKDTINSLNVFPVPDGDTGDNMYMTIKAGCGVPSEGKPLGEYASRVSEAMLLGARGNSGVILSRIFAGMSKGLEGVDDADAASFATALKSAVKEAYGAVSEPVEGTILTVIRESVEAAKDEKSIEGLFAALLSEMEASLQRTPELLDVLKEAEVVDSGGAGLLCIFRGMEDALEGKTAEPGGEDVPKAASAPDLSKFTEDSVLEFGYCTEFLLRLMRSKVDIESFDESEIRQYLEGAGDSLVFFREGTIIKVHVHTKTPGDILSHCQKWGEFLTVKVENMTLQHHQGIVRKSAFELPPEQYGIVTVAMGEGLCDAFREIGANEVILGGQTMNPSAEDFLDAFKKINAKTILVFPNNSNIILTATQAAELCKDADIRVIPSKSFGEGYYGIASVDRDSKNPDEVVENVMKVMGSVSTGMVSTAIRGASYGDLKVREGDYVGYSGKQMLTDSPSRTDALAALAERMDAADRDVILVFRGSNVPEEEGEEAIGLLRKKYPLAEIIHNYGAQPVYDYIIVLC